MKKLMRSIAFKSIFGTLVLLVIFSAVVAYVGYRNFTDVLLKQYSEIAFQIADMSAKEVDGDLIRYFMSAGSTSDDYSEIHDALDSICELSGAMFIYVIRPDVKDYGHITFVFSTVSKSSRFSEFEFGYRRETTNDEYRVKYKALYEGGSNREMLIRNEGFIASDPHITAMVPIKDSYGMTSGILCVQRQMDYLVSSRQAFIQRVAIILLASLVLIIIIMGLYLRHLLITPIKTVSNEALRFAGENQPSETKLADIVKNKDEIGLLASSIDQMEEQIHTYVENLTKATAEKERIDTELSLATRIQASMLPGVFPPFPEHKEFDIYASMDPAKEVGGDFYDFFMLDDDHLCFLIADVSGKGIPAALFMVASRIVLVNSAMRDRSPAEILKQANKAICSQNTVEMFVTVWIGILELSTGKLTASNAGHEYPCIMNGSEEFEILKDKHGFVLGGFENVEYSDYEIYLKPGAKLFVYTDGLPEATCEDGTMLGNARMLEALNKSRDKDTQGILNDIRKCVDSFVKDAEQFDDLTMLCIEYKGTENRGDSYDF